MIKENLKIMAKAKKIISKNPLGSLAVDLGFSAREISRQSKILGNYINHSSVNDHLNGSKVDIKTLKTYHKIFITEDENLPFSRLFNSEIPTYEIAGNIDRITNILERPNYIESPSQSVVLINDSVKQKNSKAINVYDSTKPNFENYIIFFDTKNDLNYTGVCLIIHSDNVGKIVRIDPFGKNGLSYYNYFDLNPITAKNIKKVYPINSLRFRNFEIINN